jgi:hypothetical protein
MSWLKTKFWPWLKVQWWKILLGLTILGALFKGRQVIDPLEEADARATKERQRRAEELKDSEEALTDALETAEEKAAEEAVEALRDDPDALTRRMLEAGRQ